MLFGMWIVSQRMGIISTSSPKSLKLSFGMDTIAVQCDGWAEWVSWRLFSLREETNAFLTKHEIDMSSCPTMTGTESLWKSALCVQLSSTWIFFMQMSNVKSGDALEIHQSEQSLGESSYFMCNVNVICESGTTFYNASCDYPSIQLRRRLSFLCPFCVLLVFEL